MLYTVSDSDVILARASEVLVALVISLIIVSRAYGRDSLWTRWVLAMFSAAVVGVTLGTASVASAVDSDPQSALKAVGPFLSAALALTAGLGRALVTTTAATARARIAVVWLIISCVTPWAWSCSWALLRYPLTYREVKFAAHLPDSGIALWNGTPIVYRDEIPPNQGFRGDVRISLGGQGQVWHHVFPRVEHACRQHWQLSVPPGRYRLALTGYMIDDGGRFSRLSYGWDLTVFPEARMLLVIQGFRRATRVVVFPRAQEGELRRPRAVIVLRG